MLNDIGSTLISQNIKFHLKMEKSILNCLNLLMNTLNQNMIYLFTDNASRPFVILDLKDLYSTTIMSTTGNRNLTLLFNMMYDANSNMLNYIKNTNNLSNFFKDVNMIGRFILNDEMNRSLNSIINGINSIHVNAVNGHMTSDQIINHMNILCNKLEQTFEPSINIENGFKNIFGLKLKDNSRGSEFFGLFESKKSQTESKKRYFKTI